MMPLSNPHQPPDVQRAQRVVSEALHDASAEIQMMGISHGVADAVARLVLANVLATVYREGADIPCGRLAYALADLMRMEGLTGPIGRA